MNSAPDTLVQQDFIEKNIKNHIDNLIIDLRHCNGGAFSSIMFVENFLKKDKVVGYFLGQKYYLKHPNSQIDTLLLNNAKPFRGKSVAAFQNTIIKNGVMKAVAFAKNRIHFKKVYVLINHTYSSGEPMAWLLKHIDNVVLIGHTTAGEMLDTNPYKLNHNWVVSLPISNFVTNIFTELEGVGVSPDIKLNPEDALNYAKQKILSSAK